MGSFGTSESKQNASSSSGINPKFLPYALDALDRAEQVGNQGYTPYMGMDVALPDSVINSWQQTADRNAAFNTPGQAAQDIRSQMPLTSQNGIQGLSSYAGYQDQLAQLQKNYPGMYDYIKSFAIDPVTGKPGERTLDTATKIKEAQKNAANGMPQYTLQQLIQQGFSSGNPLDAVMAFSGLPYFAGGGGSGGQGMTSAYQQLFNKGLLSGGMSGAAQLPGGQRS